MATRKGQIVIEKPFNGWAYDLSSSNSASVEGGALQYARSEMCDPFRTPFYGHLAPGYTFETITNGSVNVSALPTDVAIATNNELFVSLADGTVLSIGLTDENNNLSYNVASTTAASRNDVLVYEEGGNEYALWSWATSTNADIARITVAGASQDDDFFSTQTGGAKLSASVPLKMTFGADKIVYTTNGQYVASYSPITQTSNAQALNLGEGFEATDIGTYGNFIATIAKQSPSTPSYKGITRLFLWNGFDSDPTFIYDVGDNLSRCLITKEEEIYAITQGENNTVKVKKFNGTGFDTLFESKQINGHPRSGAATFFQGMLHWSPNDEKQVFCYDDNNLFSKGFHHRFNIDNGIDTVDGVGFIADVKSGLLWAGVSSDNGHRIMKMNTSQYQTATTFTSRLYPLPDKATITKITPHYSQFGSGASITYSLFKDYNALSVGGSDDLLNTQQTNASNSSLRQPITKTITDVNSFYLHARWDHSAFTDTAAVIRKIVVDYEYDDGDV